MMWREIRTWGLSGAFEAGLSRLLSAGTARRSRTGFQTVAAAAGHLTLSLARDPIALRRARSQPPRRTR